MTTISGLPYVPNIHFKYSVLLDVPIEEAYTVLGTDVGHEKVCGVNPLCTRFELAEKDTAELPPEKQLYEVSLRTQPPAVASGGGVLVNRRFFKLDERIPLLSGLFHVKVKLSGSLSWLDTQAIPSGAPLYSLYEDVAEGSGIKIWKTRKFEEEVVDGRRKTRVSEDVQGWTPSYLRSISQKVTEKALAEQMEAFHGLFPWDGNAKANTSAVETEVGKDAHDPPK